MSKNLLHKNELHFCGLQIFNVKPKKIQDKSCSIGISNDIFGVAIQIKLPESVFENFETVRGKRGQFQNFQKSRG